MPFEMCDELANFDPVVDVDNLAPGNYYGLHIVFRLLKRKGVMHWDLKRRMWKIASVARSFFHTECKVPRESVDEQQTSLGRKK